MFESLDRIVLAELAPTGTIYVKFADIRDADRAYSKIQCIRRDWSVQHIGARHFVMKHQPESLKYSPVSMYEGQVLVSAKISGLSQSFDAEGVGRLVKGLLGTYGDLMAFEMSFDRGTFAAYRAEFFSAGAVDSALAKMDEIKIAVRFLPLPGTRSWLIHTAVHLEHSSLPTRRRRHTTTLTPEIWTSDHRPRRHCLGQ